MFVQSNVSLVIAISTVTVKFSFNVNKKPVLKNIARFKRKKSKAMIIFEQSFTKTEFQLKCFPVNFAKLF